MSQNDTLTNSKPVNLEQRNCEGSASSLSSSLVIGATTSDATPTCQSVRLDTMQSSDSGTRAEEHAASDDISASAKRSKVLKHSLLGNSNSSNANNVKMDGLPMQKLSEEPATQNGITQMASIEIEDTTNEATHHSSRGLLTKVLCGQDPKMDPTITMSDGKVEKTAPPKMTAGIQTDKTNATEK